MRCPYCGCAAILLPSTTVYDGRRSGESVWACIRWPSCDAYVGCHQKTQRPKGTLANGALRIARRRAHEAFDSLWQSGRMSRAQAYRLLAEDLGIRVNRAHIGSFDIAQCERVVAKWTGSEFKPVGTSP